MAISRFCHYTIFCDNLDVSIAFYRDLLGMDVQPRELPSGYPRGAIGYFTSGDWCVHFFQATEVQRGQFAATQDSRSGIVKHLALHADDYIGMTDRLKAAGVTYREFTIGDRHLVQFLDRDALELELVFSPGELPDGPASLSLRA